jgi:hypothetical protein
MCEPTMSDLDTYCTVHVHGPDDRRLLAQAVLEIVGGELDDWGSGVDAERVGVLSSDSDEFDPRRVDEHPGGFLYFPFVLEVFFSEDVAIDESAHTVADLLGGLWERGWSAVASCDYEELLPREAGVDTDLPWPQADPN